MKGKLSVKWDIDPDKRLAGMKRGMRNKILRRAVKKAIVPLTRELKAAAPRDLGALKVSIGNKVYAPSKAESMIGIVGAKKSTGTKKKKKAFSRVVKKRGKAVLRTSGKFAGQARIQIPSKYFHLVERGHKWPKRRGLAGIGRRLSQTFGGGRVKAHPFAEPTLRKGWPRYEAEMRREIENGLAKMMPA